MKFFAVLFAFLAIQGWTSAATIPEIPDDLLSLFDIVEFLDFEHFGELPLSDIFEGFDDETIRNPEKCLPHIKKAYETANQVRAIIDNARELASKLREGLLKCKDLTNDDEKIQCYKELKKAAITQGKPHRDAYLKIRPEVLEVLGTFDKCMAGQTTEVAIPADAAKCLPYVQQAYDTVVQLRSLVDRAREIFKKLKEAYDKCKAVTDDAQQKACYRELEKNAFVQGKQFKKDYLKFRPQVLEVMDKFDKCMA